MTPFPRARKRFGQHFLEAAWVDKVLRAIAPAAGDTFVEIGPGRGALTRRLAARAGRVVAFEIDRDLSRALRATAPPNLIVEDGDFLDVSSERLRAVLAQTVAGSTPVRVAGNLPYNVASPILFRLLEHTAAGVPLLDATVMLQREVADRLTAVPRTREYGVLTILIGHCAAAELILALPPGAFRPPPKVRSALVRLRFHPPAPPARDAGLFAALVQAIFTRRRKTLANALQAFDGSRGLAPKDALRLVGIDATRRPETLALGELVRLADVYAARPDGGRLPASGSAVL